MEPQHETGFPAPLCRWVGEIVQSSPEAARITLAELIVGALLVLLTARADPEVRARVRVGGWRPAATLTPGLVKDALAARFRDFEAFRLIPEPVVNQDLYAPPTLRQTPWLPERNVNPAIS